MQNVLILDELYPFFDGYRSTEQFEEGGPCIATVECGCVAILVPGDEIVGGGVMWRVEHLCATHQARVNDPTSGPPNTTRVDVTPPE
jgi:hypothetical protein